MTPEILLINLDRAEDRLRFQEAQLGALGLSFRRIEAVAGSSLSDDYYRRVRATGARIVTRNEVGCVLSHAKCWQHSIDTGHPVIVLEDDAVLDPLFYRVTCELAEQASDEKLIVNLEFRGVQKTLGRELARTAEGEFTLYRMTHSGGGAAAYLVTPYGARKLLDLMQKRMLLADTMINFPLGLRYAQVVPAVAVQAQLFARKSEKRNAVATSTISDGTGGRGNSWDSFRANPLTRLVRLQTNVHRWVRNVMERKHIRKRPFQPTEILLSYRENGVPGFDAN